MLHRVRSRCITSQHAAPCLSIMLQHLSRFMDHLKNLLRSAWARFVGPATLYRSMLCHSIALHCVLHCMMHCTVLHCIMHCTVLIKWRELFLELHLLDYIEATHSSVKCRKCPHPRDHDHDHYREDSSSSLSQATVTCKLSSCQTPSSTCDSKQTRTAAQRSLENAD